MVYPESSPDYHRDLRRSVAVVKNKKSKVLATNADFATSLPQESTRFQFGDDEARVSIINTLRNLR